MKLLNCHIVNFGCLSERSYTFRDGLNVLYAENGSGKSTLAVFLKAMLYGFSAVNKSNLIDNERKRYTPWNGGKFGGSLCFCARGKAYRIERFFGTKEKDDTFKLYDLATQKQSNDFDSKPGNALFGVDADGFERSLYVSQRAPFLPPKNNTIRARLGNLLEAAEDLGSFEEACKKLDTARRSYITTGNRGKVGDLEREMQAKELALSAAKEAEARAEQLLQEAAALRDEKESVLLSLQKARACRAQAEKRRFLEQTSASHRRLCDAVENEASALVPLEAFFGARIPKDEHIAQMEQAVARLEGHEAQLSFCRMNKDEEAALCKLRELYGTLPPENEVSHIRRVFDQYQNAKTQVMDTAPIENAEFDTLCLHFSEKEPSEQDIAVIHKATEDYDNAEANLLLEDSLPKKRRFFGTSVSFAVASVLLLALGITCFILSFTVLGIIGCVGALSFGAFLILQAKRDERQAAKAELQRAHTALSALLLPYRYLERNPSVCAKLLFKDVARFRALRAQNEQRRAAHEAALKKAEELGLVLDASFSRYGKSILPYTKAIEEIEKDAAAYSRLAESEKAARDRFAAISMQIKEDKSLLDCFLSPFEELLSLPYREAITLLRERLLLLSTTRTRLADAKEKLASFLNETAFDPEAPLPEYIGESEAFEGEERLLSERLLQLETQISAKETEAQYQSESAACSPSLCAQILSLKAQTEEAQHTYELLDTARNLLIEAKESLSSRYLCGIEKRFTDYLSLLSSPNESYHFDTELTVTTERFGERKPTEALSRGEQDLIAFCARLSLIDSIFTEETPFLLLDDPFVNLDDKNHARAFSLLTELSSRFQIFYTVCSASRLGKPNNS